MKYYATKISENISETPEGYLLCRNVSIARTGWQDYAEGETPIQAKNGKVRIFRSEKEVFSPKTIASFEGKPFTVKHPDGLVSTENWRDLSHGHFQNVRRGEGEQKDDLVADILIMDQDAISLVRDGMRGLSCGYEADYVETGDGEGEQRNIIGNHLALVDEGRAGPTYAINDHIGEFMNKALADNLKRLLGQSIDEAVTSSKKPVVDSKEEKPKEEAKDMVSMDEVKKYFDAIMEKMDKLHGAKDAETKPKEDEPAEPKVEDAEVESGLEGRLKALEEKVSKLLERESAEESVGMDEEEEMEDEDEKEEKKATGDEKARVEILAPGMRITKDFKAEALKTAYKTADGKKVIEQLAGAKPKFDGNVDMLFISASEMLRQGRSEQLSSTKKHKVVDRDIFAGGMTPEKMNELNAKLYAAK